MAFLTPTLTVGLGKDHSLWSIGYIIDFVGNCIAEKTAFFRTMINFILTPLSDIIIFEKEILALKKICSR